MSCRIGTTAVHIAAEDASNQAAGPSQLIQIEPPAEQICSNAMAAETESLRSSPQAITWAPQRVDVEQQPSDRPTSRLSAVKVKG